MAGLIRTWIGVAVLIHNLSEVASLLVRGHHVDQLTLDGVLSGLRTLGGNIQAKEIGTALQTNEETAGTVMKTHGVKGAGEAEDGDPTRRKRNIQITMVAKATGIETQN